MTILIKGMEMPSKGCKTINIHADGTVYVHGAYPTELHKAILVPTPHGRLIDADELMEIYQPAPEDVNEWEHYTTTISVIRQNIKDAPTVIEAEE